MFMMQSAKRSNASEPTLPAFTTWRQSELIRCDSPQASDAKRTLFLVVLLALAERLGPVQRIEKAFLDGTEKETDEILAALQGHDRKSLRRSLVRYHRRRERIIPDLLAALLEP